MAVEELESGVGDLEGIGLPLLVVFDEQQIASEVVFGGQVRRLVDPLGELADGAEVGLVGPFLEAGQLQILEHPLGQGREGNAFSLGGSGRGASGSVRLRGTTCHEQVS
jgi:hypothetical protein